MRLKKNQVKLICQKLLPALRSKQLIILKESEPNVLAKMEALFLEELAVEDQINAEAEKLLEQYAAQAGGNVDKERLFQMIKKQLVKDKGVVI